MIDLKPIAIINFVQKVRNIAMVPVSPKYLRISTILIAIYKVLIAHVVLFVMLLGLAHAEEMSSMLGADMADQKEREEYVYIPTNGKGESLNQIRFKTAASLVMLTLCILYIATTLATIYVLCCLGLLIGTLRNRHEFFIPWLVVDFFGTIISVSLMVGIANKNFGYCLNEKWEYWAFCAISTVFNLVIWYVVKLFYNNLQHMTKLREVAVVAIPCPSPNSKQIPYHYRRENMHISDGGLKHILFDSNEANYLV